MFDKTTVLDDDLTQSIKDHLHPEDITPNLLSLVRVAIIAHEHAFHFSRSTTKATFLRFVESALEDRTEGEVITPTERKDNSFLSNLLEMYGAVQYHTKNFPLVTKEAFLKFVGDAFDAGEHQRKVYNCEVEGSVNNEFGVALNFACDIALFGERRGLSPKEYQNVPQIVIPVETSGTV